MAEPPELVVYLPAPHGIHALLPAENSQLQTVRPDGEKHASTAPSTQAVSSDRSGLQMQHLSIMHGQSDSPEAFEKEPVGHAAHVTLPVHNSQMLRHKRADPSLDIPNDHTLDGSRGCGSGQAPSECDSGYLPDEACASRHGPWLSRATHCGFSHQISPRAGPRDTDR
jgi:hypothetical protein